MEELGSLLTPSVIESTLEYASKRAGVRLVRSRMLRHTFCSHLAMRDAPPKAIQKLAGHATLAVTMRYTHLAPAVLRQAIELLNFSGARRALPRKLLREVVVFSKNVEWS